MIILNCFILVFLTQASWLSYNRPFFDFLCFTFSVPFKTFSVLLSSRARLFWQIIHSFSPYHIIYHLSLQHVLYDKSKQVGRWACMQERQVEALFQKIDCQSQGAISWDEFCTYMQLEYAEIDDSYLRARRVGTVWRNWLKIKIKLLMIYFNY